MEYIQEFVKPELLILVPVLYLLGTALKKAAFFADKFIPLLLGAAGVLLAVLWVAGTTSLASPQEIFLAVFTAVTQGVLVAGASVYVNQLIKQTTKAE